MAIVFCLDCTASIHLGLNSHAGQRLTCPHCNTELEVIDTSPPEVDWVYDELVDLWDGEYAYLGGEAETVVPG